MFVIQPKRHRQTCTHPINARGLNCTYNKTGNFHKIFVIFSHSSNPRKFHARENFLFYSTCTNISEPSVDLPVVISDIQTPALSLHSQRQSWNEYLFDFLLKYLDGYH
jgi:hypothetical protein